MEVARGLADKSGPGDGFVTSFSYVRPHHEMCLLKPSDRSQRTEKMMEPRAPSQQQQQTQTYYAVQQQAYYSQVGGKQYSRPRCECTTPRIRRAAV